MASEQAPESKRDKVGKSMYYIETVPDLHPLGRELLEQYSKIPPEEVVAHAHKLRDQAWKDCAYGCVGTFAFTIPAIRRHKNYDETLQRVKSGDKFLDLGCGFGQNIRRLVLDGAPANNLAGGDITSKLIECGYEYFRDRDTLESKFYAVDILTPEPGDAFHQLQSSFDIIYAAMLFHLWDRPTQLKACVNTISLLKPQPGSMLTGWQLGATPAGDYERPVTAESDEQNVTFRHDAESWEALWKEVGEMTGTQWKVEARADRPEWVTKYTGQPERLKRAWEKNLLMLDFTITRL